MFKFEDFSIRFADKEIVHIPDLELVNQGHIIIFGEIGSGKSSIAKSLIGFNEYSGNIYYNNQLIKKHQVNPDISYVPQNLEYYFIMNSVLDEIKFVSGLPTEDIEILLKKYSLYEMRYRSPQILSGGERVRLVSLLCEINQSKVLILDETVAMNDYRNLKVITEEINKFIANGVLLIEISHDITRLNRADQIVYIKDKRVHLYANSKQLITENQEIMNELKGQND